MSADYRQAILRAGGLLDARAKVKDDDRIDEVSARAYKHPVLGDRAVVRLTPSALIAGVDVEMDVLGFGDAEDRKTVGKQRRRAPGFPGWALINDPEHASYALKVMDKFKREARRARSKPGHAKQGIDAVGAELGRSVPHFLPSYYEEAGRAFLEAGAMKYAAQCFGKARDAERVHALDVDEELRHESFVEFALAGAVTIKAIAAYAKELTASYDAEVAYRRFAKLCVQRTLGGLPPWGSMAKDLRRMAKAAKLDIAAEESALLAEIIDSPALTKAAGEFWKAYRKPILALAKDKPSVRGVLLNLFPSPSSGVEAFDAYWLELLDDSGALQGLYDVDAPAETRPNGGVAAWFTKLLVHVRRDWRGSHGPAKMFQLIRGAAAALKAGDAPVFVGGRWGRIDVDAADLLLELGVTVELPQDRTPQLQLGNWAKLADRDERGRDPKYLAADERFAKLIDDALDGVIGKQPFEGAAKGKPTLAAARRKWVENRIADAANGALPALNVNIDRLGEATSVATYAEFSDLHAPLAAIDCAEALATTLRGGIFDELGWDALDEACEELHGSGSLSVTGAFPIAIVHAKNVKAIVVDVNGRLLEHDFVLPNKANVQALRYSQGQLFVVYRDDDYNWLAYWSDNPNEPFEINSGWNIPDLSISVVLEDGSVCEGGRTLSAGDKSFPDTRGLRSDGSNVWCLAWNNNKHEMREMDPKTGKLGRSSKPAFFEEFITADKALDPSSSWLLPLPNGVDDSPLGCKDGLVGWRVRRRVTKPNNYDVYSDFECEDILGRRYEHAKPEQGPVAAGFLSLPGHDEPLFVRQVRHYRGTGNITLATGPDAPTLVSNHSNEYHQGTQRLLPAVWWHLYKVRDGAGSKALRQLSVADARALVDVGIEEMETAADASKVGWEATSEAVAKRIPGIGNDRLRRGVVGIVAKAARLQLQHRRFADACDPSKAPADAGLEHVDDDTLGAALKSIVGGQRWGSGSATKQLLELSAFFKREKRLPGAKIDLSDSIINWATLVPTPRAPAFLAASLAVDDKTRTAVVSFLQAWSRSIFAEPGHAFRLMKVQRGDKSPAGHSDGNVFEYKGNDYFTFSPGGWRNKYMWALEYAPDGKFVPLPDAPITEEARADKVFSAEQIQTFLDALASNGAMTWNPAGPARVAELSGLTRAEATLLWSGLPYIHRYETSFLPKQLRTTLDLKVTEADAARTTFRQLGVDRRARLFDEAVPDDPAALWDAEAVGDSVGAAWVAQFGKRPDIPEELIIAAGKAFNTSIKPVTALVAFAQPDQAALFNHDVVFTWKEDGNLERADEDAAGFDSDALQMAALYVPFVFGQLPVGHPVRNQLPEAIERIRQRLAAPSLIFNLTTRYFYEGKEPEKRLQAFVDGIGGEPFDASEKTKGHDAGGVVITVDDARVHIYFRPARLRDDEWDRLGKLADDPESWDSGYWRRCRVLMSDGYAAMAARVNDTPVPDGGFEHNPALSVPELVEAVGAKLDLSKDACMLYLQTLAILSPSRKQVLAWNGWKPAQYKKACAELVKHELVIEAKRARAGRKHFLPGGWEALKSPQPTLESWKLPLYGLWRCDENHVHGPLPQLLPLRPLHEIFEAAWQRVVDGDQPKYEEVK